MHINPDHFLQSANGRITTFERNQMAWAACYEALGEALSNARSKTPVYVMVGPQGSGKSTWARACRARCADAIVFDAILVGRTARAPLLKVIQAHGAPAVAVWLRTSLADCLLRNAQRPADELVSEQAIRNVFAAVEPPTIEEGFGQVIVVD